MDISIIIVSWKVREKLEQNLRALLKSQGNFKMEVFVVDNNSQDGTLEMLNKNFEQIKVIANDDNLGFAKANNQAIKKSQGRYILLLNPDMKVFPDTLENMLVWMDKNSEVGVASCCLLDEQAKILPHVRRFPRFWDQLAIVLKIPHVFPRVLNKYLKKDFDYSKDAEVDSVRGSFFMIRKEALDKVGLLDERFFIWFEEVDYCLRTWKNGFKVTYTPVAKCQDYVGKSFAQVPKGKTQRYFKDSMLKYFKKWHSYPEYLILKTAWPLGFFLTWFFEKLNYNRKVKT